MILTEEERLIIAPPLNISSVEWCEKHHSLSILTSASAGRWSIDPVPFFRDLLKFIDDPDVELVCLQKSTQIAGTETAVVCPMGKFAHQDPGPAMVVLADEDTAEEIAEKRIKPMFRAANPLARLVDEKKFGKREFTLKNNFSLTMAWASSIARTASRPQRFLWLDEICKPAYGKVQQEGSVISRIFQRTESFPNKKIVLLGTVTVEGDNMDRQMQLCDAVYDQHVPCPRCGILQPLRFSPQKYRTIAGDEAMSGRIVWESKPTIPESAITARYECGECRELWTTAQKNAAVALCQSVPRQAVTGKPKRVGYHVSRLYSLFPGGRLEALVESFLRAKDDPEELQSFVNNALAEHWKPYKENTTVENLKEAKTNIPTGIVPDSADCIIVTIDMQQTGFWYLVRAWSSKTQQSWMIELGTLVDWEEVTEIAFHRTWKKNDGTSFPAWRTMLDMGGTKEKGSDISRAEEAENWWIENRRQGFRRAFLCKGSSHSMATNINVGRPLETTSSGKKIEKFGLRIVQLNTIALKDRFFGRIEQARKSENPFKAAYLNSETPEAYFRHITSEAKNEEGAYVLIGNRDNHWLDCEMMQQAAACPELFGGVGALRRPDPPEPQASPVTPKSSNIENPYLSGGATGNPYIQR